VIEKRVSLGVPANVVHAGIISTIVLSSVAIIINALFTLYLQLLDSNPRGDGVYDCVMYLLPKASTGNTLAASNELVASLAIYKEIVSVEITIIPKFSTVSESVVYDCDSGIVMVVIPLAETVKFVFHPVFGLEIVPEQALLALIIQLNDS
jgi:hypothetical protein